MARLIIDGENCVLGRIGSSVSKELLKGNHVILINCEKIIVSGDKKSFAERIRQKQRMGQGSSLKGPKYIKREDLLVKRILRGMLPWDRPRGREAHKRLRCEIGTGELKEEDLKSIKTFEHQKPQKYASMKDIVRLLK
jgi:large subunit ribosomal protein L13